MPTNREVNGGGDNECHPTTDKKYEISVFPKVLFEKAQTYE
jgi:hypothetical protein